MRRMKLCSKAFCSEVARWRGAFEAPRSASRVIVSGGSRWRSEGGGRSFGAWRMKTGAMVALNVRAVVEVFADRPRGRV